LATRPVHYSESSDVATRPCADDDAPGTTDDDALWQDDWDDEEPDDDFVAQLRAEQAKLAGSA